MAARQASRQTRTKEAERSRRRTSTRSSSRGGDAPEHFCRDQAMVRLVRETAKSGKIVAAICHGGLLLAAAGVLAGKKVTGFRSIAKDLTAAGATYLDQEVVVDHGLITSRRPGDLPAFMAAILRALATS